MTDALDLDAVEREINRTEEVLTDGNTYLAARLVHQQARECVHCGGTGRVVVRDAGDMSTAALECGATEEERRCPICAPARAALAAIVGGQR